MDLSDCVFEKCQMHPDSEIAVPSERRGENLSKMSDKYLPERSVALMLCFTQELLRCSAWSCWDEPLSYFRKGDRGTLRCSSRGRLQLHCLSMFSCPKWLWKQRKKYIFRLHWNTLQKKTNPFRPLAAQPFARHRQGIKPWCNKNIGSRSLPPPATQRWQDAC